MQIAKSHYLLLRDTLLRFVWRFIALVGGGLAVLSADFRAETGQGDEAYTITTVMEIAPPADPKAMNDHFQNARLLATSDGVSTIEVCIRPFRSAAVTGTYDWHRTSPEMARYRRATATEDWDREMRRDLLRELDDEGIRLALLTDKEAVERVTRWALKRAANTQTFLIWTLHYPNGRPEVFPPLRKAFEEDIRSLAIRPQTAIAQEASGRTMFYDKVHGSCTSVSIYISTILRALGIPTRVIVCIPPFDPNDPTQAKLFFENIQHHRVARAVKGALQGDTGFVNHVFNEVYVGGQWVRLNYNKLGQPVMEASHLGLMIRIATFDSISAAPLAQTWGLRYFSYPNVHPKLSSINPYRLVSIRETAAAP